jgi:hypothetical protein
MGQGRRFPHFWRCIILIATAIQGITPDPQDLASLKLLRMICPILGPDFRSRGEDESVADGYEPLRMDQCSRIRQVANELPFSGPMPIWTCAWTISPDVRPVGSHRNEVSRPHGLSPSLGRLRC